GGWGADWPAIATVIPPLFDSRINLTSASNGQDYGNYRSDTVNNLIDKAANLGSVSEQAKVYAQIDDQLGKDVAYIPLEVTQFYFLHGSKVTGYLQSPASSGYVVVVVSAYILRRLVSGFILMIVMSLVTFLLFFANPIDPARFACGKNCSPALQEQTRKALGFDKPVIVQWGDFLKGVVVGRDYP